MSPNLTLMLRSAPVLVAISVAAPQGRRSESVPVERTERAQEVPRPKRAWGPEQATGAPDSPDCSDAQTSWASQLADGGDEWLLMTYAEPVHALTILVYENHKPGALRRVTVFDTAGKEVEVWKGQQDPTLPEKDRGVSEVNFQVSFKIKRVKLHLASGEVEGWNEIDAVGLKDPAGKVHWASEAEASSTYAQGAAPAIPPVPAVVDLPTANKTGPPQTVEKTGRVREDLALGKRIEPGSQELGRLERANVELLKQMEALRLQSAEVKARLEEVERRNAESSRTRLDELTKLVREKKDGDPVPGPRRP